MTYLQEQVEGKSREFRIGFRLGIISFAHWNNGKQYVGTSGMLLSEALTELQRPYTHEAFKADKSQCQACKGSGLKTDPATDVQEDDVCPECDGETK